MPWRWASLFANADTSERSVMRARGIGREGWVSDNPIREIPKFRQSSIGCAPKARFAPDSLLEQSGFEPLVPLPSRTGAEPYRPAFNTLRGGKQERSSLRRGLGAATSYRSVPTSIPS
jgi:hypothetical protein